MNGFAIAGVFFLIFGGLIYAAIQMRHYEEKWEDEDDDQ
jgi:hypothetical protein